MTDPVCDAPTPQLTRVDAADPRAVVLLLHGGRPTSNRPVDGRSASWRVMRGVQRSLTPLVDDGVSTRLVAWGERGWNGGSPRIAEARAALDAVRRELGPLPLVLLGHSMGARAAVQVADDPLVRGVVALAPWFEPTDPVAPVAGRIVLAAHGRRDRITSFAATQAWLRRAESVARRTELRDMGWAGHYLLSRRSAWRRFVRTALADLLAP